MKELKDLAANPQKREEINNDCVQLVNSEVKSKRGVSGIAIKAGFGVVKAIKPRMMEDAVEGLLDEFMDNLQVYYKSYQEEGEQGSLESYLGARGQEVAECLLSITDRRASGSTNRTLVKAYNKLRGKAKEHVSAAAPGIGRVLDKHVER